MSLTQITVKSKEYHIKIMFGLETLPRYCIKNDVIYIFCKFLYLYS